MQWRKSEFKCFRSCIVFIY